MKKNLFRIGVVFLLIAVLFLSGCMQQRQETKPPSIKPEDESLKKPSVLPPNLTNKNKTNAAKPPITLNNSMKNCADLNGQICQSDEICSGNLTKALNTDTCCVGKCSMPRLEELKGTPFAINGFYMVGKVASLQNLSQEAAIRKIETGTIPFFLDLGIKSGRIHPDAYGSFSWDNIDKDFDGKNLDFSMQDSYVKLAQEYNISLLPALSPDSDWLNDAIYIPENKEAYKEYIKQTVERYDGDGIDDMPGLKYAIKYWQLENEPDLRNDKRKEDGFLPPEDYFEVLKLTYGAVKEADKEARLMPNIAGLGQDLGERGINYLTTLTSLGARDYFDAFSYHVYADTYDLNVVKDYNEKVKNLIGNKPIWITETAIAWYTGNPKRYFVGDTPDLKKQARWLVKDYVFHFANGVEKIFWLNVEDASPSLNQTLLYGLTDFRTNKKKPSYYTLKLLVTKLDGFSSVDTINFGKYKFNFENKAPVYVLWNDSQEETIDLSNYITTNTVLVTHIIEEENQTQANTEISSTKAINIGKSPVLVEAAD